MFVNGVLGGQVVIPRVSHIRAFMIRRDSTNNLLHFFDSIVNTNQRLRDFLDQLEAVRPGARQLAFPEYVQHEGRESIHFQSPTNDGKLSFWIWIDDEDEMSITFADWHTHESVAAAFSDTKDDALVGIAHGILDSRFVMAIDVDGEYANFSTVVWIDNSASVAEMFAEPWSPATIRVRSWDGSIDAAIHSNSPPIIGS